MIINNMEHTWNIHGAYMEHRSRKIGGIWASCGICDEKEIQFMELQIIPNEFIFKPKVHFGIMPIEYFEIPFSECVWNIPHSGTNK
jgi:hypothetical protein